jgi:hypothetical protein
MFAMSVFITTTEHSKASRLLPQRLMVHAHHMLVHLQHNFQSPLVDPHVPDIRTSGSTRRKLSWTSTVSCLAVSSCMQKLFTH